MQRRFEREVSSRLKACAYRSKQLKPQPRRSRLDVDADFHDRVEPSEAVIRQETPGGENSSVVLPSRSRRNHFSSMRLPKPRREGGVTGGPPLSRQCMYSLWFRLRKNPSIEVSSASSSFTTDRRNFPKKATKYTIRNGASALAWVGKLLLCLVSRRAGRTRRFANLARRVATTKFRGGFVEAERMEQRDRQNLRVLIVEGRVFHCDADRRHALGSRLCLGRHRWQSARCACQGAGIGIWRRRPRYELEWRASHCCRRGADPKGHSVHVSTGYGAAGVPDAFKDIPVLQKPFNVAEFRRTIEAAINPGASHDVLRASARRPYQI